MTNRERLSVTIAALYALQKRDHAMKFLRNEHSHSQYLVELFFHLSLLLGFPAMLDGFEKLSVLKLLPRSRRQKRPHQRYRNRGLRALKRVYGGQTDKLLQSLGMMHPDLPPMIIDDVYGKVIARPGMNMRERELVNVTVLTIQGLNRQLYSHVRGALRMGVPPATLRKVFQLLAREFRVDVRSARELLAMLAS